MHQPTRLTGIDLCRGLAAFAVILVHSGDETWGIPIGERAIQFRYLFYFAVPFFLAASFYFATKKLPLNISLTFWQKKFKRIVVPYLLWSTFYIVSKSIVFLLTNNANQITQLLADPVAIIFLGGASYHLYFIPLLVVGTLWLYLVNYLIKCKKSIIWLFFGSLVSILIYQLLLSSNNSFNLGSSTAFPQLLSLFQPESLSYMIIRVILVYFAWILRCLPYFLLALLINQLLQQNSNRWLYQKPTIFLLLFVFLLANSVGNKFLPDAFSEIAIAFGLLLFGISISKYLKDNALITNLGLCSFGIYLIHPFIKSAVEIILIKFLPQLTQSISIPSMLIYSISSFLVSWLVIAILLKNKFFARYI
jgi:peptidoglycan/LPS O-acetylase OafA/YrhL